MRLFRAIGEAEYRSLIAVGGFRSSPGSMEGKWFAETFADAVQWGVLFGYEGYFWVVETDVPDRLSDEFFRLGSLDGIGPARFAELEQLDDSVLLKGFTKVNFD